MAEHLTPRERVLIQKFSDNPIDFFTGETRGWLEDFLKTSGPSRGGGGGSAASTGDYKISAQTATHTDGSGTWYLCDGSAIPAEEEDLILLVGSNVPDARGRALVMLGTHPEVNLVGENEGIGTVANRRPKHGHTVVQPTISSPAITQPTISAPSIVQPTISAPSITQPTISAPSIVQPTISAPSITQPTITVNQGTVTIGYQTHTGGTEIVLRNDTGHAGNVAFNTAGVSATASGAALASNPIATGAALSGNPIATGAALSGNPIATGAALSESPIATGAALSSAPVASGGTVGPDTNDQGSYIVPGNLFIHS